MAFSASGAVSLLLMDVLTCAAETSSTPSSSAERYFAVSRPMAAVRYVESLVYPQHDIPCDDEDFDGKVEDVEARLGLIAGRVADGAGSPSVISSHAEGCTQAEQGRGDEENGHLVPPRTAPKLLEPGGPRDNEAHDDENNGEESDNGVKGLAVELDVSIDVPGVVIEGEEGLNDDGDEHGQGGNDQDVDGDEGPITGGMPSDPGMGGPKDPLGENEIDDKEQHHAGGHEYLGGNSDADVGGMNGPDDPQDLGDDAGHAEAEQHARHNELVAVPPVDLENGHV
ncbi:MAG: hypothetical protein Q9163_005837 [Psora crenata]